MSKSFSVAVEKHVSTDEEPFEFTFEDDPDQLLQVWEPTQEQVLVIMSFMDIQEGDFQSAALAQSTLLGLFPEESRTYVKRRLADRTDPLTLEHVMDVFELVVEAAGARPTESSPASSPSRATNGKSSTGKPRRKASTRSTSPSTDSATTSTRGASRTRKSETS